MFLKAAMLKTALGYESAVRGRRMFVGITSGNTNSNISRSYVHFCSSHSASTVFGRPSSAVFSRWGRCQEARFVRIAVFVKLDIFLVMDALARCAWSLMTNVAMTDLKLLVGMS